MMHIVDVALTYDQDSTNASYYYYYYFITIIKPSNCTNGLFLKFVFTCFALIIGCLL